MFFKALQTLSDKIKTPFSIRFPNSHEMKFGEAYGPPLFHVEINTKKGLRALKSVDELKIAEAYIYGDIDLKGQIDMLKLLEVQTLLSKAHPLIVLWSKINTFFSNQKIINKKSISEHYEFDHDFYLMFLDKTRTYSQGIFIDPEESLEQACTRKLEFAKNNCHLVPGKKVLDIGSGWGNAVEYLGKEGIEVDALTISNKSFSFISNLIESNKLFNCQIIQKDFLEYKPASNKRYDAIFSLGTLEHLPNYKEVLSRCDTLLNPGAYAYFDASAINSNKSINSYFIDKYIFPGNHSCLDIYAFLEAVKKSAFNLISLHNDSYNYYLTLKHWAQNLDKYKKEIISKWSPVLYRKFQLYLWGCCYNMLHKGGLEAYRIVLQKKDTVV